MACTFPINKYLLAIGLSNESISASTKATLDRIVEHHTMHLPFQNFHLFHSVESRNQIDLSPEGLVENFLIKRQGGMCYQQSELLFHALSCLGYEVRRLEAVVTAIDPYHPKLATNHDLLIATVDGQEYLLDVGFGYNSLRAPLPIRRDEPSEVALTQSERYQWRRAEDHYELYSWIGDQWRPFYGIKAPLTPISGQQALKNFINLRDTPDFVAIRDRIIKAGMLTKSGRIGYYCEPHEKFTAYRLVIDNGKVDKYNFSDMASFVQDVEQTLNIEIPPRMPGYCNSAASLHE